MSGHPETASPQPRRPRPAQALVEFSVIALVLYLLLAGIMEMGRALTAGQTLQLAADTATRELSRRPLPAGITLQQALQDPEVRRLVFDEDLLVIDLDNPPPTLPIVNQQLRSLMIYDNVGGRNLLRYPGALFVDQSSQSGFHVGILDERLRWVPVIEEVGVSGNPSPFAVQPPPSNQPADQPWQSGIVSLRINYPFQAASLSAFQQDANGQLTPVVADDGAVTATGTPPSGTPNDDGRPAGTYAGPYGLGRQLALGQTVRPFRKFLSMQAVYRREIVE